MQISSLHLLITIITFGALVNAIPIPAQIPPVLDPALPTLFPRVDNELGFDVLDAHVDPKQKIHDKYRAAWKDLKMKRAVMLTRVEDLSRSIANHKEMKTAVRQHMDDILNENLNHDPVEEVERHAKIEVRLANTKADRTAKYAEYDEQDKLVEMAHKKFKRAKVAYYHAFPLHGYNRRSSIKKK